MTQRGDTSGKWAAARAKAREMMREGVPSREIATALGVSHGTVRNWSSAWQAEMKAEAAERSKANLEGAAAARELLAAETLAAAETVARIAKMRDVEKDAAPGLKVVLVAAAEILDRGGVPVVSKSDMSVSTTDDETARKVAAAIAAARNG